MTAIVEIVRHRVKGLYVISDISSSIMEDVFEPLEEGLDRLVFKKLVVELKMCLTKVSPTTEGSSEVSGCVSLPIPEEEVLGMHYYKK